MIDGQMIGLAFANHPTFLTSKRLLLFYRHSQREGKSVQPVVGETVALSVNIF